MITEDELVNAFKIFDKETLLGVSIFCGRCCRDGAGQERDNRCYRASRCALQAGFRGERREGKFQNGARCSLCVPHRKYVRM